MRWDADIELIEQRKNAVFGLGLGLFSMCKKSRTAMELLDNE